ncbi:MurR/RpiR family transcriptional regulator [Limosilactobacillus sp.]|jgi:RpiR family glv operon transcriptional regulator|uniref:MurR/RpiR family transcriptional regulator n=1 Tax=Limosilactobacillus sp. TaxID=2773925 RepID=UPI0025BF4663|nr:MurR/RpiR family transcriptional regulator [Limosilactobacillus sp.]MCH3921967.1 MurR/RpiR family transcriptional regulator [Limosilactobacillus sp.]MCH3928738.1 MurR/RpiR family transcriptional regulator [Limosilactobacillus sp.]
MNFFDIVGPRLKDLSDNEHKLFDFVVKNMDEINGKSIREVASLCYVSTATFLRFVRKLGFSGFSEFTTVIKFTLMNHQEEQENPFTVPQTDYRNEYTKNIEESIRVLKADQLKRIADKLAEHPHIFLFAKDTTKHLTEYIKYLFSMSGFNVSFPPDKDYRRLAEQQITDNSLVFIMSFNGENAEFVKLINGLIRQGISPMIVSITEADNNTIQNLSDVNFYIFTDKITINETDIGSRISVIAIMELILYQYIESYGGHDFNLKKNSQH